MESWPSRIYWRGRGGWVCACVKRNVAFECEMTSIQASDSALSGAGSSVPGVTSLADCGGGRGLTPLGNTGHASLVGTAPCAHGGRPHGDDPPGGLGAQPAGSVGGEAEEVRHPGRGEPLGDAGRLMGRPRGPSTRTPSQGASFSSPSACGYRTTP